MFPGGTTSSCGPLIPWRCRDWLAAIISRISPSNPSSRSMMTSPGCAVPRWTVRPPSLSTGWSLQRGFIVIASSMLRVSRVPLVCAVPETSTIFATTAESPDEVNAVFNSLASAGMTRLSGTVTPSGSPVSLTSMGSANPSLRTALTFNSAVAPSPTFRLWGTVNLNPAGSGRASVRWNHARGVPAAPEM